MIVSKGTRSDHFITSYHFNWTPARVIAEEKKRNLLKTCTSAAWGTIMLCSSGTQMWNPRLLQRVPHGVDSDQLLTQSRLER